MHGEPKINTEEFQEFLEQHKFIPNDDDSAFILDYMSEMTRGKANPQKYEQSVFHFTCLMTTKRLLRNALEGKILHADMTYKLNWQGFPIHVYGTTDNRRSFHPIAIALSTKETRDQITFCLKSLKDGILQIYGRNLMFDALMSDAAHAIKNAFHTIFPDGELLTCWFHVRQAVKKYKFQNKETKHSIERDIVNLHIASNKDMFEVGVKLFIAKWKATEKEFIAYFQKEWLCPQNRNWFAGAKLLSPCTNNALENFNRRLKDDFDLRQRTKLAVFKTKILETLHILSCEYRDAVKVFNDIVLITDDLWQAGLNWALSEKKVEVDKKKQAYYVPAGEGHDISKQAFVKYIKHKWTDFDNFIENKYSIWTIIIPTDNNEFNQATCSCPKFLKEYSCKHILGMGLRLQKVNLPHNVQRVENRRCFPGRPRHARPALQHQ